VFDWAWRKGHDYRTILVDLDRHRVIDLLANRSVDAFRAWLEQHPGSAVIARDRSGSYAEAASLGAPERCRWRTLPFAAESFSSSG
jgi:transposase